MEYTIKELCELIGKSEQSIYKLMQSHDDFSAIVKENSRRAGSTPTKVYNENVLAWLKTHYNIKTDDSTQSRAETIIHDNKKLIKKVEKLRRIIKKLRAEKENLLAENDRLLTMLEKEQETRQSILLSFVAERQKQIYLDKPKRRWWNKRGKDE